MEQKTVLKNSPVNSPVHTQNSKIKDDLLNPINPVVIVGKWVGQWDSGRTRGSGKLYAKISRVDDQNYRAVFTRYSMFFYPVRYRVTLRVDEEKADHVALSCTRSNGLFGGKVHIQATATPGNFVARFSTSSDVGQFTLKRS